MLGKRVKDSVTGFVGVAITKTEYLHGHVWYTVISETKNRDGTYPSQDFAEGRLSVLRQTVKASK